MDPSIQAILDTLQSLPREWLYAGGAGAVALVTALVFGIRALRRAPAAPGALPTTEALPTQSVTTTLPRHAPLPQPAPVAKERTAASELEAQLASTTDESARATLKDQLEEARSRAYQAEKAAAAAERERRRKEREEAQAQAEEQARVEAAAAAVRAEAEAAEARARVEREAGQALALGLAKTRTEGFVARLQGLFGRPIDDAVIAELEEVLLTADIGVRTASHLVSVARSHAGGSEKKLRELLRAEMESLVSLPVSGPSLSGGGPPHVVMVVGVNGTGKTTTIGKLAARARSVDGKRVLLGAGDTFRAAASDQLEVWAERAGVEVVSGAANADSASVLFETVKKGVAEGYDLILADTAGRLHTKVHLMDELSKVRRVLGKAMPGAPHEVLLVLDAATGQNALTQAKQFLEATGVTGIVLTKLDGTARGGVVFGICHELKVPVRWVGVGERVEDLRPFDAKALVAALFAEP